jgi:hypothetical protein
VDRAFFIYTIRTNSFGALFLSEQWRIKPPTDTPSAKQVRYSMDVLETSAIDAEEKWIAKYRSALDAAPVPQDPRPNFREALGRVGEVITLKVAEVLKHWMPEQPQRSAIEIDHSRGREFHPTKRKEAATLASDESLSQKVG